MRGYLMVTISTVILAMIALGCAQKMVTTKPEMQEEAIVIRVIALENVDPTTVTNSLVNNITEAISNSLEAKGANIVGDRLIPATHILTGSIVQIRETVSINARLIDVKTGKGLRAKGVRGEMDEIPELTEEISQSIWRQVTTGGSEDPVSERRGK